MHLHEDIVLIPVVVTALVAVIHRGAGVIYQDNATPVEPWVTGTSPGNDNLGWIWTALEKTNALTGQQ